MDAIKLVPQLFYDLISRIIPGFTSLFFFTLATGKQVGELPALIFKDSNTLQNSIFFLLLVALLASYLIGQIIALLSDSYEEIFLKRVFSKYFNLLEHLISPDSQYPKEEKTILINEIKPDDKDKKIIQEKIWIWYDWIRVKNPEAGARCAKVRAEYRMHAGISVVMIFTALLHVFSYFIYEIKFNLSLIIISIILAILFTWVHARIHRMFERNVIGQFLAIKRVE